MDVMINGDWQNNHMNTTYLEQLKLAVQMVYVGISGF